MRRNRSSMLGLGAVLLAAACAGGPSPQMGITPLSTPAGEPDSCGPSPVPAKLPTLSALGDSDTLAHAFARAAPDVQERGAIFSVLFGPTGRVERALVLRPAFDTAAQRSADSVVSADLRGDTTGGAWPVRVRMTGGPAPTFEIDRSRFCPPVPVPEVASTGTVVTERPITSEAELIQLQQSLELRRGGAYLLRVLVDATGTVTDVQWVLHSASSTQDRTAYTAARNRRFSPASVDGVPVPAWFDIGSERK